MTWYLYKSLTYCRCAVKAISPDSHLTVSFLPPVNTRAKVLLLPILSLPSFQTSTVQSGEQRISICICHSETPVQRAQEYAGTSQENPQRFCFTGMNVTPWRLFREPCPRPHFACFTREHLRLSLCSCCASFGKITWRSIFSPVWYYHSLTGSGRLSSSSPFTSSLELSLLFQQTGKLVFLDQNQQISILERADRKGAFIFLFLKKKNLTFQGCFSH